MKHHRALLVAFALVATAAGAQEYPTKPVTIVLGLAAGTGLDMVARTYGEKLSQSLGRPVVFDNRPGAASIIAITALFSLIVTFANFDIVRILTAGGPIDRTHVFATWSFWLGIQGSDIPLGAAVSLFMVPILTVAAVFILRDINRRAGEMS